MSQRGVCSVRYGGQYRVQDFLALNLKTRYGISASNEAFRHETHREIAPSRTRTLEVALPAWCNAGHDAAFLAEEPHDSNGCCTKWIPVGNNSTGVKPSTISSALKQTTMISQIERT